MMCLEHDGRFGGAPCPAAFSTESVEKGRDGCGFLKDSSTWAEGQSDGETRGMRGVERRNLQGAFISAHFAAKSAVKMADWDSLSPPAGFPVCCHIMAVTF